MKALYLIVTREPLGERFLSSFQAIFELFSSDFCRIFLYSKRSIEGGLESCVTLP